MVNYQDFKVNSDCYRSGVTSASYDMMSEVLISPSNKQKFKQVQLFCSKENTKK